MVKLLRHRQTKGAETDRLYLRSPRHILTLPFLTNHTYNFYKMNFCSSANSSHSGMNKSGVVSKIGSELILIIRSIVNGIVISSVPFAVESAMS